MEFNQMKRQTKKFLNITGVIVALAVAAMGASLLVSYGGKALLGMGMIFVAFLALKALA